METSSNGIRVPTSYTSKKPYRGVNTFLLTVARSKAGYDSNFWLTFKQIQELGGNVKGERSEMVVFWKLLEKPAQKPTPDRDRDYIPMLRYYRVFNLDQVSGIEKPSHEPLPAFQPIAEAEAIATRYQEQSKSRTTVHGLTTSRALTRYACLNVKLSRNQPPIIQRSFTSSRTARVTSPA